jgi:2-polyprenyl-3-methyl-5-hydroxy-6-metoxy-1,4-benzoquinol methylase
MNKSKNWDLMSKDFDNSNIDKLNEKNSDNMKIAWPIIIKDIKKYIIENSEILDFGCGMGSFSNYLTTLGYKVTGMDYSKEMINLANKYFVKNVKFIKGSIKELNNLDKKFNIITSIMVLQFIEEINEYVKCFYKILDINGIVTITVFNPDFVKQYSDKNIIFGKLKKFNNHIKTNFELTKGIKINVYIRSENQYKKLFEKQEFKHLSTHYPPFTQEFVKKYNWPFPYNIPEFMIMSFQKN